MWRSLPPPHLPHHDVTKERCRIGPDRRYAVTPLTHDAPYGAAVGFHGQIQGARSVTRVLEAVQPAFHVAGHLALIGPRRLGPTVSLVLDGISSSPLWNPSPYLQVGCLAVLDTDGPELRVVGDDWLARFPQRLDFDAHVEALVSP